MSKNFVPKNSPSLTAVVHAAVKNAPSGLDARTVSDMAGKPYQTLMSELSRQEGHKLGADLLLPLMEASGSTAPLEFLARQMGGAFIPLPSVDSCDSELVKCLANSMKEASEFFAVYAENLADGVITAKELSNMEKEADEAIESILSIKKMARAEHEKKCGD